MHIIIYNICFIISIHVFIIKNKVIIKIKYAITTKLLL